MSANDDGVKMVRYAASQIENLCPQVKLTTNWYFEIDFDFESVDTLNIHLAWEIRITANLLTSFDPYFARNFN